MAAAGFQRIEHTADVGLRLTAPTVAELFVVATEGLHALWGVPQSPAAVDAAAEAVEVEGPDPEGLLVAWLNELIYQADVHGRVAAAVCSPTVEHERFRAQVTWQPLRWEDCVDGVEIKAATYHTVHVTETDGGVSTTIIFDV